MSRREIIRSGFLEEEQMRGRSLGGVVDRRRLLDVFAAAVEDGSVGGARVDSGEVDVGVDGAENEAEEAQDEDGDDASRYQRLSLPVRPVAAPAIARCRQRRCRGHFRSYRHFTHRTDRTMINVSYTP